MHAGPTTPTRQRHRAITPDRFRLIPVRSPLLGESRLLSLPRPTEMFHFGRFPPRALCVQTRVTGHDPGRVSPFGYPRISALLAAPRGFSQPHASFIGSWRQGIPRTPFVAPRALYCARTTLRISRSSRSSMYLLKGWTLPERRRSGSSVPVSRPPRLRTTAHSDRPTGVGSHDEGLR